MSPTDARESRLLHDSPSIPAALGLDYGEAFEEPGQFGGAG
jgi:hypothetical protein